MTPSDKPKEEKMFLAKRKRERRNTEEGTTENVG